MLTVGTLNQFYGGSHTLWDLSLDVPKGSCTCLMGRNGMGKTTLLKCIMGLLPVASGTIEFEGRDLARLPPQEQGRGHGTPRRPHSQAAHFRGPSDGDKTARGHSAEFRVCSSRWQVN